MSESEQSHPEPAEQEKEQPRFRHEVRPLHTIIAEGEKLPKS